VHHVRSDAPPFLLVHGEADGLVPFAQSEQLAAALRGAGSEAELIAVPGADHVFLGTDPLAQIARGTAFLRERLRTNR
jgi:dipeptidyl aminopeptidase/acylaminoacyl peptidase